MGGKTIVGALIFGLIAVELMKHYIGVRRSTGDLYAIPLALGIAIGRIGCFLTGLSDNTYGTTSNLPWAINFGDGIPRHPVQLYEIAFLLFLIPIVYQILKRSTGTTFGLDSLRPSQVEGVRLVRNDRTRRGLFVDGDAFKFFMVAYMSFRLACDFLKPYPRVFLDLEGIQWACIAMLLYYSPDMARWLTFHGESR